MRRDRVVWGEVSRKFIAQSPCPDTGYSPDKMIEETISVVRLCSLCFI